MSNKKSSSKTRRLDALLLERGECKDLKEAQALIYCGQVLVGEQRHTQPSSKVPMDAELRIERGSDDVGRGAAKLRSGVASLGIASCFMEATVLDIGASTGGFTQAALEYGARHVVAVDVGTNQLAWKLRQDKRVTALEQTDVRSLKPDVLPAVDLILTDVSFIGLRLLAPVITRLNPEAAFLLLVKPQFELPVEDIPPGGVVEDPKAHDKAVQMVVEAFAACGLSNWQVEKASLKGRTGNQEFFLWHPSGRKDR